MSVYNPDCEQQVTRDEKATVIIPRLDAGRELSLEALIAKLVYGHDTEILKTCEVFSPSLHLIAQDGEKILGGEFQKARTQSGEMVNLHCRPCPAWTINLLEAWKLLQDCKFEEPGKYKVAIKELDDIFRHEKPREVALAISRAIVNAYEARSDS